MELDLSICSKRIGVFNRTNLNPNCVARKRLIKHLGHPESISAPCCTPVRILLLFRVTGITNGLIGVLTIGSVMSSSSLSPPVTGMVSRSPTVLVLVSGGLAGPACESPLKCLKVGLARSLLLLPDAGIRFIIGCEGGSGQSNARCPGWSHQKHHRGGLCGVSVGPNDAAIHPTPQALSAGMRRGGTRLVRVRNSLRPMSKSMAV